MRAGTCPEVFSMGDEGTAVAIASRIQSKDLTILTATKKVTVL
jgi:hypothetical protein